MAMRVTEPNTNGRGGKRAQYNKLESRQRAIENGDNTYWSPYPCKRAGHIGLRRTSSGKCIECERMRSTERKKKRHDDFRANITPAPRSLGAYALMRGTDLTPTTKKMEPQCQPKTKNK